MVPKEFEGFRGSGREERGGREGRGRRGEEEEREGHVFLTFRMVFGRASLGADR